MNADHEATDFSLECRNTCDGWCEFAVCANGKRHTCDASWIGDHPTCQLLLIAVTAHQHYFVQPYPEENAIFTLEAEDEPGGIQITSRLLADQRISFVVEQLRTGTIGLEPDQVIPAPYNEGVITLRQLLEQAYKEGTRLLQENGITGTRVGWAGWRWDSDSPPFVFPVDHFIFVSEYLDAGDTLGLKQPSLELDIKHLQRALKADASDTKEHHERQPTEP